MYSQFREVLVKMQALAASYDTEVAHFQADHLLLEALEIAGIAIFNDAPERQVIVDLIRAYNGIDKMYA